MLISAGARLGNYEIVAPLGAGGMGEVYRARDTRLGRDVALKVLPADVAADADRLARFEREARTVAASTTRTSSRCISVEDEDGIRFLTMELVEGQSLDRHVTPGGLPVARVVELGIALADALAAAHEKGVVHRDLKPANVMLTRDGRVKVLDFGLAKLADSQRSRGRRGRDDDRDAALGRGSGHGHGAVHGAGAGARRGRRQPHRPVRARHPALRAGDRAAAVRGRHARRDQLAILRDTPASLASVRADAPADLDRIVARCLEKEPRARFQTALDVRNELRRAADDSAARAATILKAAAGAVHAVARPRGGRSTPRRTRCAAARACSPSPATAAPARRDSRSSCSAAWHPSIPAARPSSRSRRSPRRRRCCRPSASRSTSPRRTAARRSTRCARSSASAACCCVLDNLEQVLDAAGDIAALVSRCPALQVIATSRAPLKIGAESEFGLPPLELPAQDATSLDALAQVPVGRAVRPARREGEARLRAHASERARRSPRSAGDSTACRSRSSSPRRACASSSPPRCCSGSTTRSTC